ncbi:hypothetical protein Daus18300_006153 [Diaporthe australafricana]|uniref:Uncharacterized protein n=1 Tax=Diaporthe australafricana TaxID=127596 RepID=A0ABR3WWA1_9PEZI
MTDQIEKTPKKKSLLSKVGSAGASAIGLILMGGGGDVETGFHPNYYGVKGGTKLKRNECVAAPDQMRGDACRALYIPKHNGSMKGVLPVCDFTESYRDKLRDENIGSDKWKYTLGLMRKPQGDGKDDAGVAYLVDFEEAKAAEKQIVNVRRRTLKAAQETTTLQVCSRIFWTSIQATQELTVCSLNRSLPIKDSDAPFTFTSPPSAEVHTVTTSDQGLSIANSVTAEAYPAPWFTLTSAESTASYQWQIHPFEHGPLRYTLIELPSPGQDASAVVPENQHRIKAIYHNVGVGWSLVQPFSEGVLLLPTGKNMDADLETAVVTSLIGLLWKTRGVQKVKYQVPASNDDTTKTGSREKGGFFRKSRKDGSDDDVIR